MAVRKATIVFLKFMKTLANKMIRSVGGKLYPYLIRNVIVMWNVSRISISYPHARMMILNVGKSYIMDRTAKRVIWCA